MRTPRCVRQREEALAVCSIVPVCVFVSARKVEQTDDY